MVVLFTETFLLVENQTALPLAQQASPCQSDKIIFNIIVIYMYNLIRYFTFFNT